MANNKISKYFKRLDTNQILTSDADFLSMPLNTKIARDTGEEYIKRYGNVFDKTQKSFITSESADGLFAKLKEDNTFTANNTFEKGAKLGQEPTLLEHATTKKYVDGKIKEANDEITNIINGTNQKDSNIAYINKNNQFRGTQNFTNVAIKGTATSKTPIATSNDTTIPTTAWVNAKQATVKQKGLVQLINSYTSTSQTLAPTANALKQVYDMLGNRIDDLEENSGGGSDFLRFSRKITINFFGVKINTDNISKYEKFIIGKQGYNDCIFTVPNDCILGFTVIFGDRVNNDLGYNIYRNNSKLDYANYDFHLERSKISDPLTTSINTSYFFKDFCSFNFGNKGQFVNKYVFLKGDKVKFVRYGNYPNLDTIVIYISFAQGITYEELFKNVEIS